MARLLILLLIILGPEWILAQPAFVTSPLSIDPPLEKHSILKWFDSEGDGDMDFMAFYPSLSLEGRHKIRLYVNDNQHFQGIENPIRGGLNIAAGTFFVADGDQDGDADIAYTQNSNIKIAWNNGDNTFTAQLSGREVSQDNVAVFWVDMDGDFDLDLVTAFQSVDIYWNHKGTYLEETQTNTFLDFPTLADINNDGITDMFGTSYSDGNSTVPTILLATGRKVLSRFLISTSLSLPFHTKSKWGDVDNDKDVDLFILDAEGRWTIFQNQLNETGQLSFEQGFQCTALSNPDLEIGDINSDGLLDFIISGLPKTMLYLNKSAAGTIQFQGSDLSAIPSVNTTIQTIDFDQGNGLDFFFRTEDESGLEHTESFYLNTLTSLLPQPEAPSDLSEDGSSPGVLLLSWNHPHHARLSYRVEVFKDGIQIASAGSLENGVLRQKDRIPQLLKNSIAVKIEDFGIYSWRVQAIDAMYQPSAFSATRQIQISMPVLPFSTTPSLEIGSNFEWMDVDGDGDLDILSAYPSPLVAGAYRFRLYENSNHTFLSSNESLVTLGNIEARSYCFGDPDNDNDADILYVENRRIKIAMNNGDKTFNLVETGLNVNWDGAQVYWADMDGDKGMDIITQFTPDYYSIVWNREGTYAGRFDYYPELKSVFPVDFNNDGLSDFITVRDGGWLAIAYNEGRGQVITLTIASGYQNNPNVKFVDIDNDQDLDLIVTKGTGQWQIFRNALKEYGTGVYAPVAIGSEEGSQFLDVADLNSDGLVDVVLSGQQTMLYINRTTTSGPVFDAVNTGIVSPGKSSVSIVDIDEQAGPDLLWSSENAEGTTVVRYFYLNTLSVLSDPPAAPTNLTEVAGPNGYMQLSWNHGGNATYRIELFRDGKRIVSSESSDTGDPRRRSGGCQVLDHHIDLQGLTAGIYIWKVQAIDASNRGSAFSTPRQFVVSETNQTPFRPYPLSVSPPFQPEVTLEWLDTDRDGDLDILAFNEFSGKYSVSLYINDGGRFVGNTSPILGFQNINAKSYYIADGNHDNLLDFVFIENNIIKIAKNNGNNSFTIQDTGIIVNTDQGSIEWVDIDADSDLDLVTMLSNSNYTLLLNQQVNPGATGVNYPMDFSSITFAELSNDRTMDFLAISVSAGYIVQSISLSDGSFSVIRGIGFTPHPKLYWSDADNDGDVDMFALGSSGWKLFKNEFKETGKAQLQIAYPFPTSSPNADVGDIDSDGLPDFVVVEPNGDWGYVTVFLNKSSTTNINFQSTNPGIKTFRDTNLSLQDIDGDMKLDIILNDALYTDAYKNTLINMSPPPQAPTNLHGSYTGGMLMLSWASVGEGKNYRLELSKDGVPFVASGSNMDGKLLKTRLAPLLVTNNATFSKLPEGTYTWTVQSVDASNRGSAFSPPQQVTVGPSEGNPVTGLEEYAVPGDVRIFPNPARHEVYVSMPSSGKLLIRNQQSQTVFDADYDISEESTIKISTATWAAGIYILDYNNGRHRWTKKLVVIR